MGALDAADMQRWQVMARRWRGGVGEREIKNKRRLLSDEGMGLSF